ncbi:MAG: pyrroline-5-carboxylate reductase [Planctomycetota bacterium]|nr:pyrroline-5-carboxylate reductase [Planctomycetota bacterium]
MHPAMLVSIGGGTMAHALIAGSLAARALTPEQCAVAEPDEARRARVAALGVPVVPDAAALSRFMDASTQVLLAVKPQSLEDVASVAAPLNLPARVLISILAGTTSHRLARSLGSQRIIRVMPNTPAQVGAGCAAVALAGAARPGDEGLAMRILSACCPVVERIDESLMDAFTALAGSGPAYVYYLAEAMELAASQMGFDSAQARRFTRQVIAGAARLMERSAERNPADLRADVTSKGGTTEAACRTLDLASTRDSLVRAILAARDRGAELARL